MKDDYVSFEVCYWRKWWGLRNAFTGYLIGKYKFAEEPYEYVLDREDIMTLRDMLEDYSEETWDNDYWDYNDCTDTIKRQLAALKTLMREMTNFDECVSVVFYDSY